MATETEIRGPAKGDFIQPPAVIEADEAKDALPAQEEFWRPPTRFGSVPVEKEPLGWDRRRGFRKLFPPVSLPFQVVERVQFGHPELEPNRLFWGDNLHVMRQLASESIDLIYIDPPFFSGRNYNVIFGDQNELRSFSDIWEGGMPGYLIWLNARLYEMKRLLKPTGSILVHCDWHASHYIKVELDRLFGHDNFQNELVWCYRGGGVPRDKFARKHDIIFWYRRGKSAKFNVDAVRKPYSEESLERLKHTARAFRSSGTYDSYKPNEKGKHPEDWMEIQPLMPSEKVERIGYPTQKPMELLQKLIEAFSDPGDTVADFFGGGGSFIAAASGGRSVRTKDNRPALEFRPELARRWIGCDQSRVAIAVAADRITKLVESLPLLSPQNPVPDFTVEHWGVYESARLAKTPPEQFRNFVLTAFGARIESDHKGIHGMKGAVPVWVGEPDQRKPVTAEDVIAFANAIRGTLRYQQDNLRDGVMLAWAFRPEAVQAAERLKRLEQTDFDFIRLEQVRIDSPRFREHVSALSTTNADYENFLTFVQPPRVEVAWKRLAAKTYRFDAGESIVMNSGAKIINVQWDFEYGERFSSTPGHAFRRGDDTMTADYEFDTTGWKKIAARVQDDLGGEGLWVGDIEVS